MRRILLPVLAGLLLATPAAAQAPEAHPGTISVVGTSEIERKPDFARIFVTVGSTGETVGDVVRANATATEAVLARLQALGIARDAIETADFQVIETPPRHNPDGSERKVPKYTAHHRLRIMSRKIDDIGRLAGEILAVDGMTFQSIAWGLDRSQEAENEALRKAVQDARRQAEVFASAAQVTLGPIRDIREGSARPLARMEGDVMPMRMAAIPSVPIVPPATVRYTASVQMTWDIAPPGAR